MFCICLRFFFDALFCYIALLALTPLLQFNQSSFEFKYQQRQRTIENIIMTYYNVTIIFYIVSFTKSVLCGYYIKQLSKSWCIQFVLIIIGFTRAAYWFEYNSWDNDRRSTSIIFSRWQTASNPPTVLPASSTKTYPNTGCWSWSFAPTQQSSDRGKSEAEN